MLREPVHIPGELAIVTNDESDHLMSASVTEVHTTPIALVPRESRERPRILLLAYSCVPGRGSEPGMGWNRSIEAAKDFDTWVVCEGEGEAAIDAYFEEHGPQPNLHFVYLRDSRLEGALKESFVTRYVAFNLWNRRAGKVAEHLHQLHDFDLVHHVTFSGFREPGYLWKLEAPFVWGPIGGAQNYPWRFLAKGGLYAIVKEGGRNIVNTLQMWLSFRVRRAARRATLLLAANTTNSRAIANAHGVNPVLFPDTGVRELSESSSSPRTDKVLRIFWCGGLSPHKALHLLIEALAGVSDDVSWELHVAGSGPLRGKWEQLAEAGGINDRISWLGNVAHKEALAEFAWADAFVFTSLRDTTGTVLLEALAAGLPIICLDHQGGAEVVDESCGIKVPVTRPAETIAELTEALERLALEPAACEALSRGALRRAERYLWAKQGEEMAQLYRQLIADSKEGSDEGAESPALTDSEPSEGPAPRSEEPSAVPPSAKSEPSIESPPNKGPEPLLDGNAPSSNSLTSWISRLWDDSGRSGLFGLVDQGFVSAVRFATTVAIGRLCGAGELGTYALAFSLMLIAINVQDSLVLGPFVVYANRMKGARKARYAGSVLAEAVVLAVLAVFALAGVALALQSVSLGSALGRTLAVLAVMIPCILLHHFGRRFAFAELDMRTAMFLDVSSGTIQLAGLAALALSGTLSATSAYAVVGIGCALPGLAWLTLRHRSFVVARQGMSSDVRKNWRLGRWMLASQVTTTIGSYASAWILALLLSVEVAGIFVACASIVCLTNPILLGLNNVLVPRVARAYGDGGCAEVRRVSRQSMFLLVGMTGLAAVGLTIFGHSILALLYGADYAAYSHVITLLALATLLNAARMSADQSLLALERSDLSFAVQVVGVGITCLACLLLIPRFGVYGAGWAPLLGAVFSATFVFVLQEVLTRPRLTARRAT